MNIGEKLYSDKGTIIRLSFISRSGKIIKVNPIQYNSAGFIKGLSPVNDIIDYTSESEISEDTIVMIDEAAKEVHSFTLDGSLLGLQSLVIYPDGSTWEGLIGESIPSMRAAIWSPNLATKLKSPISTAPWPEGREWKKVPTSIIINDGGGPVLACRWIEHSCGEDCK